MAGLPGRCGVKLLADEPCGGRLYEEIECIFLAVLAMLAVPVNADDSLRESG